MPVSKKPAQGKHKPVTLQQQEGFQLTVDAQDDTVRQVWVRFGRLDNKGKNQWDRTIALGDVAVSPGQSQSFSVSKDQLPVSPNECFYQFLLEVDGEHDTETLMTVPAKLA